MGAADNSQVNCAAAPEDIQSSPKTPKMEILCGSYYEIDPVEQQFAYAKEQHSERFKQEAGAVGADPWEGIPHEC